MGIIVFVSSGMEMETLRDQKSSITRCIFFAARSRVLDTHAVEKALCPRRSFLVCWLTQGTCSSLYQSTRLGILPEDGRYCSPVSGDGSGDLGGVGWRGKGGEAFRQILFVPHTYEPSTGFIITISSIIHHVLPSGITESVRYSVRSSVQKGRRQG